MPSPTTPAPSVAPLPRLAVDIKEVAEMNGVSVDTVRWWIETGHLKPLNLPGKSRARRAGDRRLRKILFDINDVMAFVVSRKDA